MFLTPKFAFALPPSSVNLRHFDCKLTEGVGINQRYAQSNMYLILATTTDHSTIFELDWEKVPEGIFDEDDSNAIEV